MQTKRTEQDLGKNYCARPYISPTADLSDSDLYSYRQHGLLYIRGAVTPTLLVQARKIIEPWVDFQIEGWLLNGLISRDFHEFDFWHRLLEAWRSAGKPKFRRQPNRFLINPEMFEYLHQRPFLDIAERVLGTTEISVHGIFNARPQLPGAPQTDTPFHQDSQYWGLNYDGIEPDTERQTHVLTMWIPLQEVDSTNGALHLISKTATGDRIFTAYDYDYKNTGYLGLSPKAISQYPHICEPMEPGDVVIFDQRTPHGAKPNNSGRIRWSVDIRYERTETATTIGRKFGFICQSHKDPKTETTLATWLKKRQTSEKL